MIAVFVALTLLLPGLPPEPSASPPGIHGAAPLPAPPGGVALPVDPGFAAWSLDLGVSVRAAKSKVTGSAAPKPLCPLGDVDGDGDDDILARYTGKAEGKARFQALAGPGFTRVLWTAEPRDGRLAKCGADVTGDGAADPILVMPPADGSGSGGGPVVEFVGGQDTMTPVDGATGQALGDVVVDGSGARVEDPTGIVPAEASVAATSGDLLPSATDTLVAVAASQTAAGGAMASATQDAVQVQVVGASGEVRGTVQLPEGSDAVAVAALPPETGAAAVLTEREAAVDQVPAGVPTVTVAGPDGDVLWEQVQDATTGVPVLLPQAGDVDGDGIGDLVYATVPADVAGAVPSSGYAVLSGADGEPILESAQETLGLQTALPFGDADGQGGDEVLVVAQASPGAPIELSVVDAGGAVQWAATVPGGGEPANVEEDANGNAAGFSDLTGDGVPDAAVSVPSDGGLQVVVIDGASGELAWDATFPGADSIEELPADDVGSEPTSGAEADSSTASAAPGQLTIAGSDLVVVDADAGTVARVDGRSGRTVWQVRGDPPASPAVEVQAAGDVDGDGAQDVLVTIASSATDATPAFHAVSGADGASLWSDSGADDGPAPAPLVQVAGTGVDPDASKGGRPVPLGWLAAASAVATALAAVVALRRRTP